MATDYGSEASIDVEFVRIEAGGADNLPRAITVGEKVTSHVPRVGDVVVIANRYHRVDRVIWLWLEGNKPSVLVEMTD